MVISNGRCAFALIALIVGASASCKPAAAPQKYDLNGKVVSVDNKGGTVTVAHQAIPGYMEAMTMPFKLKDERLLKELTEGDRLQATLVVAGLRSWLEDVVVTRETLDPSSLAKADARIEPNIGDEVPDFSLVNQNGKRISLHQYRGKTVALTFIYTRCPLPDYCPLMTDNFAEIEKGITDGSHPDMRLISITLDPEYDTPKVLRDYAAAHSADTTYWEFATGTKDQIKQVSTYFGMQYWTEGDQVIHSLRTAIVGPDGRLMRLLRGNEWKPDDLLKGQ